MTISGRNPHSADQTDAENAKLKKLVGQLQNNLCDVSVVSGPDLDSLSNMDPNSLVDITGKDFMDSIKDSPGRLGGELTDGRFQVSSASRKYFLLIFRFIFLYYLYLYLLFIHFGSYEISCSIKING